VVGLQLVIVYMTGNKFSNEDWHAVWMGIRTTQRMELRYELTLGIQKVCLLPEMREFEDTLQLLNVILTKWRH